MEPATDSHEESLPPGTRLGKYEIKSVLGAGGFGITYLAEDTDLGRQVVIKENLPAQFAFRDSTRTVRAKSGDADKKHFQWSLDNFLGEAETLAKFNHPNIVSIYDRFEMFGTGYFVMEFRAGRELNDLINEREDGFSEDELRQWLEPLLGALGALHDKDIFHRDLKPQNILITDEGEPVLIDFGAARQLIGEKSMTVVMSKGYTPLEQLQSNGNIGPWTDIYGLSGAFYKALVGKAPPGVNDRLRDDPIVCLADEFEGRYSASLLVALDLGLSLDEENRPQSCAEMLEMLEAAVPGGAVTDPMDEPTSVPKPPTAGTAPGQDVEDPFGEDTILEPRPTTPSSMISTVASPVQRSVGWLKRKAKSITVVLVVLAVLLGGGSAVWKKLQPGPMAAADELLERGDWLAAIQEYAQFAAADSTLLADADERINPVLEQVATGTIAISGVLGEIREAIVAVVAGSAGRKQSGARAVAAIDALEVEVARQQRLLAEAEEKARAGQFVEALTGLVGIAAMDEPTKKGTIGVCGQVGAAVGEVAEAEIPGLADLLQQLTAQVPGVRSIAEEYRDLAKVLERCEAVHAAHEKGTDTDWGQALAGYLEIDLAQAAGARRFGLERFKACSNRLMADAEPLVADETRYEAFKAALGAVDHDEARKLLAWMEALAITRPVGELLAAKQWQEALLKATELLEEHGDSAKLREQLDEAATELAYLHKKFFGEPGEASTRDDLKALGAALKTAADEHGSGVAAYLYAMFYAPGDPADWQSGLVDKYAKLAIEHGYPDGHLVLGTRYKHGRGSLALARKEFADGRSAGSKICTIQYFGTLIDEGQGNPLSDAQITELDLATAELSGSEHYLSRTQSAFGYMWLAKERYWALLALVKEKGANANEVNTMKNAMYRATLEALDVAGKAADTEKAKIQQAIGELKAYGHPSSKIVGVEGRALIFEFDAASVEEFLSEAAAAGSRIAADELAKLRRK